MDVASPPLRHHCTSRTVWRTCDCPASPPEYVKQAVEEDRAENYEAAYDLYIRALEHFQTHLKYDKNPSSKKIIKDKVQAIRCKA